MGCVICNKPLTKEQRWKGNKTCSKSCGNKLGAKYRRNRAKIKQITRKCWQCGKNVPMSNTDCRAKAELPAFKKKVPVFCNRKCWIAYIRKNGHTRNNKKWGSWGEYIEIKDIDKVADEVYDWRMRHRLTQAKASIKTGICKAFFSRIENFHVTHITKKRRDQMREEMGIHVEGEIAKHPRWAEKRR